MVFLVDIIKGIFIGIANIIPGVSGGTMAVSLGLYDKIIDSVSNLFKNFKKSIMTLSPIAIGCAIGIIGFTYAIEYLLSKHTYLTCMTFIGLILGGIPVLVNNLKSKTKGSTGYINIGSVLCFVFFFAFAIVLPIMGAGNETVKSFSASPQSLLVLFLIGIVASATMVIPGVSGSLVLMILGYYYGIINTVKSFFEALKILDFSGAISVAVILVPFGIGIIIGIFLIAKLITYLFNNFVVQTYCSILGLIAASPFAIFYNTGLINMLGNITPIILIIGIAFAFLGSAITFLLGEK